MSVAWSDYGKYATDIFTDEAIQAIEDVGDKHQKPLFLYLAHLAVHSANTYSPLQAPSEVIAKFKYIQDPNRRRFAGMLYKLDESVGKVVNALKEQNMLQARWAQITKKLYYKNIFWILKVTKNLNFEL